MSNDIYDYADRVSDEMLEELRLCALWGLRSMDASTEVLQWPVDELAIEMVHCADYARKIQEIFKMLLIEQGAMVARTDMIDAIVARVRAALQLAGIDASNELMYTPIDFDVVPGFAGVDAYEVNAMRPKVWKEGGRAAAVAHP